MIKTQLLLHVALSRHAMHVVTQGDRLQAKDTGPHESTEASSTLVLPKQTDSRSLEMCKPRGQVQKRKGDEAEKKKKGIGGNGIHWHRATQ